MKISEAYTLRQLDGRGILLPERLPAQSRGKLRVVSLSDSAYWLLKSFDGREFTMEQAVDAVCARYDAERPTVEADLAVLLGTLGECGALV